MATHFVGLAPLTTVRRTNGEAASVYAGGAVPDDITDDDKDRLLAEGFIAESTVPAGGMQHDVPGQVPHYVREAKDPSPAVVKRAEKRRADRTELQDLADRTPPPLEAVQQAAKDD